LSQLHQLDAGIPAGANADVDAHAHGSIQRWYVLALLTAIYTMHAMDRNLVSIVLEPVKKEFALSDTAAGVLSGTAYALSFALAGIPLGLLVDRLHRRNLLAVAVGLWSAVTAFSGLATGYASLIAARIGLAVFEAPSLPASVSIIADLFGRHRRATAIGIYSMGLGVGQLIGYAIGGLVAGHWGWRDVFFVGGAPGLILAIIFLTTVKEPVRRSSDGRVAVQVRAPPVLSTFSFILAQPSLRLLYFGYILLSLTASANLAFLPSFFIRTHGLTIPEVGLIVGVGFGLASIVGSLLGGMIADRLSKGNILWVPRFGAIAAATVMISTAAMVMVPSAALASLFMVIYGAAFMAQVGPNLGLNQSLVGTRMRGTAAATLNTLVNLFAQAIGATLTGFLSDRYAPWAHADALRYALFTISFLNLAPVVLFALIGRTLKHDLDRAERA
jgi:predicted MFS family arabinose efflux permease